MEGMRIMNKSEALKIAALITFGLSLIVGSILLPRLAEKD